MNTLSLLFRTDRFNLSEVMPHFINPCCFGEDVAAWLANKLHGKHTDVHEPYQEDWGWEIPVKDSNQSYFLCISGNSNGSADSPNNGEWRIIVEKRRSILDAAAGSARVTPEDHVVVSVKKALLGEPSIHDVRLDQAEP
jgi:hypothetical protein